MRYPIILTAPDGRQITCYDGEHAGAVHLLSDWLTWDAVGRFVRDRDGSIDWSALEAQAPLHATSEQLLAAAALDLYGAHNDTFEPATLKRLCQVLDAQHWPGCWRRSPAAPRRRPTRHRPDPRRPHPLAVRWGWRPVSDRATAKAKTYLNVALMRLDEAARLAHEAGLLGQAGILERLARDAAEVLGKLQPTRPADLVDQSADGQGRP
jgi:hypothetical protein